MILPTHIEVILRQSEQHTMSAMERIRSSQSALETIGDHHRRMLEAIEKSRALLAGLNGHEAPSTPIERQTGLASIEPGPAEG